MSPARSLFALAAIGAAIAACSSSGSTADAGATASDASDGYGSPIGGACDPTSHYPCTQPHDACSVAVCDPSAHVCVIEARDASGCAIGPSTCGAAEACASGFVCVTGLCFAKCEGAIDCDGGACTPYCTSPPGCAEDDACVPTCVGYCT